MRKTFEELEQIKEKHNVDKLWSWSRINSFHNSKYEYFLRYIKKVKPDNDTSVYGVMGGIVHDLLEEYYLDKISYDDCKMQFNIMWDSLVASDIKKFDRTDADKNRNIKTKYYANLNHYFENRTPKVEGKKVELERFILVKFREDILLQGYVDFIFTDEDKNFVICDFKTSTIYTGAKKLNECGQLIVYAIGLNQLGVPFDRIRICWNFLKYVKVNIMQKNGKIKERNIERVKLGESLKSNAKTWLNTLDITPEEIENYLMELVISNSIECLPKEIQSKFEINDCYEYVDITEELVNKWINHVVSTVDTLNNLEQAYELVGSDDLFFDTPEEVSKQQYYYFNLCGYSRKLMKPFDLYLTEKEEASVGLNLLDDHPTTTVENNKNNLSSETGLDFSWLEDLI